MTKIMIGRTSCMHGNMVCKSHAISRFLAYAILLLFCPARDTLTYENPISAGSETSVSAKGKFELGFFTPFSFTYRKRWRW
ncbi:hypothetical protein FF1_023954 [Malus domestica]|uniref:Uncharacterized protein n=1 Tax=Malus domestica TaxID=3750 RepID=A0A498HGB6_MALDO|nr:hypothetical protein DVH24_028250 [Malus domestica]